MAEQNPFWRPDNMPITRAWLVIAGTTLLGVAAGEATVHFMYGDQWPMLLVGGAAGGAVGFGSGVLFDHFNVVSERKYPGSASRILKRGR